MEILKRAKVADIALEYKINSLITLNHDSTIGDALQKFALFGILSAPVLSDRTVEGRVMCIGSVDVLDLVCFLVADAKHAPDWREKLKAGFKKPVFEALNSSSQNPFYPVQPETSLFDVVSRLFQHGVHRVPVFDDSFNLATILAQSDIAAFIWHKMQDETDAETFELGNKTLDELGLIPGLVLSVKREVSVMNTFDYMMGSKVSGVAVVNDNGQVVGNISASDLKGFTEDTASKYLEMNAGEFVKRQMMAISVKRNTTLRSVCSLFVNLHIHRVYIIDDEHKAIGVVSLTDLMKILSRQGRIV